MKRFIALGTAITVLGLVFLASAPAGARTLGPNGRIAFFRTSGDDQRPSLAYTMNPDGSDQRLLFPAEAEHPHWSPDGTEIAMEVDSIPNNAAVIVNPDTGAYRVMTKADPTLDLGCFLWSPDGTRLACASVNEDDPRGTGVYTIRSSDGGGLTKVTSPGGIPGDYSPDGKRLTFVGPDANGDLRIFVVRLNGSGRMPLTPASMSADMNEEDGGSWSPSGNQIVFSARPNPDSRYALWEVNPDGSGLHRLPIAGCGGAFADPTSIGCIYPSWSPDGTRIAFTRISSKTHQKNIWVVNPDGTGLSQVTRTGFQDFAPDWGTHPLS
jgi:Tol biopolymer transport system component